MFCAQASTKGEGTVLYNCTKHVSNPRNNKIPTPKSSLIDVSCQATLYRLAHMAGKEDVLQAMGLEDSLVPRDPKPDVVIIALSLANEGLTMSSQPVGIL